VRRPRSARCQPTAWAQLDSLDWHAAAIQHTASNKGHGRRESRSIKTLAIADSLGGIALPHAKLALRFHRRREETGQKETRETVYAVTSLDTHQAKPAELASHLRGHWTVEAQHNIRDRAFAEDASTVHTGNAPRAMAAFRNLAIGALKTFGATNIAKTTRAIRDQPERAISLFSRSSGLAVDRPGCTPGHCPCAPMIAAADQIRITGRTTWITASERAEASRNRGPADGGACVSRNSAPPSSVSGPG
jgi:predicted transposase YbfD/YdcC